MTTEARSGPPGSGPGRALPQSLPEARWVFQAGKQEQMLSCLAFEAYWGGGKGGGKTDGAVAWGLSIMPIPGARFYYFRKEERQIIDDVLPRLENLLLGHPHSWNGSDDCFRFPTSGADSQFYLRGCDTEAAARKYNGRELHRVFVDEVSDWTSGTYENIFINVRSAIPGLDAKIRCGSNAWGDHLDWVKERFDLEDVQKGAREEGWPWWIQNPVSGRWIYTRCVHMSSFEDNQKLQEQDPMYMERLMAGIADENKRAALTGYGDYTKLSGAFFKEWDRRVHVMDPQEVPKDWPCFLAYDYGIAEAPGGSCVLCFRYNPAERRLWVTWEVYTRTVPIPQVMEQVVQMCEATRSWPVWIVSGKDLWDNTGHDDQQGRNKYEVAMASLRRIKPEYPWRMKMGIQDRENKWDRVHSALRWDGDPANPSRKPKVRFFNTCRNSIRTIPALTYSENNPGELPRHAEDHCADALGYGVCASEDWWMAAPPQQRLVLRGIG